MRFLTFFFGLSLVVIAVAAVGKKKVNMVALSDEDEFEDASLREEIWLAIGELADEIVSNCKEQSTRDKNGVSLKKTITYGDDKERTTRMNQEYNGVPVFGRSVVYMETEEGEKQLYDKGTGLPTKKVQLKKEKKVVGDFISDLLEVFGDEIDDVEMGKRKKDKLDKTKEKKGKGCKKDEKENGGRAKRQGDDDEDESWGEYGDTAEPIIYVIPGTNEVVPAYLITIADGLDVWKYIVDEEDNILEEWNDVKEHNHRHKREVTPSGTGFGGNVNTRKWRYDGTDKPFLEVSRDADGMCKFETSKAKTIDWKQTNTYDWNIQQVQLLTLSETAKAYEFPCSESTDTEINGGYSPVNDIHYHITVTVDMFQKWYNTTPFEEMPVKGIAIADYNNAMYVNKQYNAIFIGDGKSTSHPFSTLESVAHEIGHGVTEESSNLKYRNYEAGGLNEAFSDMLGIAAVYFDATERHTSTMTDWTVGRGESLTGEPARYMENPPDDDISIDHVKDYRAGTAGTEGTNPHYSSGIYNKVFVILAKSLKYGIWDAMDIFYIANTKFWQPETTFVKGAQLTMRAVEELKQGKHISNDYTHFDANMVAGAFAQVGIYCIRKNATSWTCSDRKFYCFSKLQRQGRLL